MAVCTANFPKIWCFLYACLVVFVEIHDAVEVANFVSENYLENGQLETLVRYNQFSAKEVTLINKNQSGLSLRQMSDGKRFLQIVFDEDIVKDCQFILEKDQVQSFLQSFNNSVSPNLESTSKFVIEGLQDKPLPADIKKWFHFRKLYKICHQKHKEMRAKLRRIKESQKEDTEIRDNYGRSKRDLSDIFRLPGTQWCGKGYSATKYTDVGLFSRTDRCCRQHDLACPYWIGGLETKYGIHNFMVNTLMHCSCDERFRACLKRVGTTDANLVGNIFFNFVQRECFTMEPTKVCNKKYHNHEKRKEGKFRKKKDLNNRRTKRNQKKCKKRKPRKAVIKQNHSY